jgi:post-segregation antitoxin (ccd killing protein)
MNTALNIRDIGKPVKAALAARAKAEGVAMSDLARDLLADALGVEPETPAQQWKREHADGLAAMDRRAEARFERVRALSDVPYPVFDGEEA